MSSPRRRPTELVDMGKLMSMQGIEPLLLAQTSGPGHPRKIRVLPLEEMILGRDEGCQIVLDEDAVSRQHAKVLYADYQPELLDLGSTNGTFLNGKQIHRAFLKPGDELQVGASVFRVSLVNDAPAPEVPLESEGDIKRLESLIKKSKGTATTPSSPQQSTAISGRLSEIRLSSLLQIIESDKSTGTLVILSGGQEGKLYIHQGGIRHVTLGRAQGAKALYRLMALEDGRFEFFIPGRSPEYDTVKGNLQKHLLEAMRQKDELELCKKKLPPLNASLVFNPQKHIIPAKVPPAVFDVLAAAGEHESVGKVIEHCRLPDFEIARMLLVLLKHNVLTVVDEESDPTVNVGITSASSSRA